MASLTFDHLRTFIPTTRLKISFPSSSLMSSLHLWTVLALIVGLTQGAIVETLSDVASLDSFDYIVVGGGTAGNVIANRLTEDPSVKVLVLEAGPGYDDDSLDLEVPFYCTRIHLGSPFNWNYTTTPQTGLNGRSIPYPRGFVLGGSSSVNYLGYVRGSSEDYDRYARISGDDGWSWKNLQKYIRRNERFVQPVDGHNTTGKYDPSAHGYRGINTVTLSGYQWAFNERVVQATQELSDEFPYNIDTNSGYQLGFGWAQSTIKDGSRSSSATSYLASKYSRRPNLTVLVNAYVLRVLPLAGSSPLTIRGVEFSQDRGETTHVVHAKREIVLSSGSIGTPHILLHSGIGNATSLTALGITPIHDLPSVGQNLSEHPVVGNPWLVNTTDTFEELLRNETRAGEVLSQWKETRTGPLVNGVLDWLGFFRIDGSVILRGREDPAAGPTAGHYELVVSNGLTRQPVPATGNFLSTSAVLLSPTARGSITLNSSNPFDAPLIDPNLLGTELDLAIIREGFLSTRRFASASSWEGYVIRELNANITDENLDAHIRNTAASIYHPVGTAAMSEKGAGYGVVDPDLRVKGVQGLRIVDASVLPFIPAAHTQAPVYIFAERAADLIKGVV